MRIEGGDEPGVDGSGARDWIRAAGGGTRRERRGGEARDIRRVEGGRERDGDAVLPLDLWEKVWSSRHGASYSGHDRSSRSPDGAVPRQGRFGETVGRAARSPLV